METSGFKKMVTETSGRSIESIDIKLQTAQRLKEIKEEHGYEQLSFSERVILLRTLILELASTKEGTDIPIDNNNRFLVEALAVLLKKEEIEEMREEDSVLV